MEEKNNPQQRFINRWWFKLPVLLALCFALVLSGSRLHRANNIKENAPLAAFTGHLDESIPSLMEDYAIPGVSVALVRKGAVVWTKAYGYADLGTGRKMTTDTWCRVESISKSVTAWGVMKLVEKGRVDLDAPIKRYLKNWNFPASAFSDEKVTVRLLLSHNAGLPLGTIGVLYSPKGPRPSLEESLSKDAVLVREPGSSFSYSNAGFNLLELMIQEVTGRDFADYMKAEVLLPLGMDRSSFDWSGDMKPPVPNGHGTKGKPIPVYVYPQRASGGLFASVEDIAAFVTAGMPAFSPAGRKVLTAQSIEALHTPMVEIPGFYGLAFESYGLGHFIERLPGGEKALSHGGQGTGWMTHFHSVPETGDGIVILTNSQRSWPFFAYILSDWAKWCGFSSLGMGRIVQAQKALWALIGLALFTVLWRAWGLAQGLLSGERRFAPLAKGSRLTASAQGFFGILLASGLLWAMGQDYLFITSVFPIASGRLGAVMFLSAVVLVLPALFTRARPRAREMSL